MMADTFYRIFQTPDGGFAVEIISVGALPQTAAGFATEAAAKSWIARDKRFRSATGPFWVRAALRRPGS